MSKPTLIALDLENIARKRRGWHQLDLNQGADACWAVDHLLAAVRELRAALADACNELQDALQYKGENLVRKHEDKAELARLRAVLARYPEEPSRE